MQVLTRARGGCVVHRCQNKNPIERLTSGCEWSHAPEARTRRIWGILKKSVNWFENKTPDEKGRLSGLAEARQICARRAPHKMVGADGKASIERLCLSFYVETFNSKVMKGFVPELRSRKCFSCFEIPMFYVYMLRTLYVHFTYPFSCMGMLQNEKVANREKNTWSLPKNKKAV